MSFESIQEMFSGVAARCGALCAVERAGRRVTYAELETESNRLANFLLNAGVRRGSMVSLLAEDPARIITGILGCLKAGVVFVPLDPTFPGQRLGAMTEQVRSDFYVVERKHLNKLARMQAGASSLARVVCLDAWPHGARAAGEQFEGRGLEVLEGFGSYQQTERPSVASDPDAPCSVYFTSGSTGKPKAILGRLKGIDHYMRWEIDAVGAGPGTRVTQLASPSFDGFLKDAFVPLCAGGTVCAPESRDVVLDAGRLIEWLDTEQIEVLHCVPSVFRTLINQGLNERHFQSMRCVVLTGEPLYPSDVKRWTDVFGTRVRLWNIYGTTETTLSKLVYEVKPEDVGRPSIPVGCPIKGSAVVLINSRGQLCREEVVGEIHIRTPYRSHGYYNEPELTREVFVPNPFNDDPSDILHKTGDFGRLLKNGELEILGRRDQQVKVRGVRVELGEIENLLRSHEAVADVAVIDRDDAEGNKFLVAYVTLSNGTRAEELRPYLAGRLLEAMVPSALVKLEQLPRTLNGKIDRKALPALELLEAEREMSVVGPLNPVEEIVAGIWCEVLRLPAVGRSGNFFNLGGHSLLVTQVILRIQRMLKVELPIRSLFETPTLEHFARLIQEQLSEGGQSEEAGIEPAPRTGRLPLSFSQQRMWFVEQFGSASTAYHISLGVSLKGPLNITALEQSFGEIISRHESLRTTFPATDGEPAQVIHPPHRFNLPLVDLSRLDDDARVTVTRRLTEEQFNRPFELGKGPLLRLLLVRYSPREHAVVCTLHHIISDGWSKGVLVREISALYESFHQGESSPLPAVPMQYADFAVWEQRRLQGGLLERELAYWKQNLAGAPATLSLPTDRPRPSVQTSCGGAVPFRFEQKVTQGLKDVSRRKGVTLFMTLLASFQTLLHRYTSQDDIVVGTSVASRDRFEIEGLIGCFVNMLALRTDCSGNPRFAELLQQVRETTLRAYAHQGLPFEKLVEELRPERNPTHQPLFQVMLSLQSAPVSELAMAELTLSVPPVEVTTSKYDLLLDMWESSEGLAGTLEYNSDLFDRATVERIVSYFMNLVEGVVSDPERRLSELPLMSEEERREALTGWNIARAEYPKERGLHELFERQAGTSPDAIAAVLADEQLSYGELNRRANRLARHLQEKGIRAGDVVGLWMEHSLSEIVGILGVLKAGAAYLPLDPAYPPARLSFMLADAGTSLVLTQRSYAEAVLACGASPISLDADWPLIERMSGTNFDGGATPEHDAYIIYTSGSTGVPKGVAVSHRAVVNYVWWAKDLYLRGEPRAFALYSSLSFDLTVTSIFTPLITGNTLFIYPQRRGESPLAQILREKRVEVLKLTPAHLSLIKGDDNRRSPVRRLVVGGEALTTDLAREVSYNFGGRAEIFNEYGPTEATVGCMSYRFDPESDRRAFVPIGKPAPNARIYILDPWLGPTVEGAAGEICIGGEGLARGYLNRAELTAERFVPDPFSGLPGARMYRTGDLARRLESGVLDYLGRADEQVKIRGHRVEPGEVEAALRGLPGVVQAAVVARELRPGEVSLVGYVVPASREVADASALKSQLAGLLPGYMVPASLVMLGELPLTEHGKLNRKALPGARSAGARRALRTPAEEMLCGLFQEVLGVEHVNPDDDFFELGGHSLLAARLVSGVGHAFGVELPVRLLFESPTPSALALRLDEGERATRPTLEAGPRPPLPPASYAQRRLWFLDRLAAGRSTQYNMAAALRLRGPLDVYALTCSFHEIVRRHESLRTTFRDEDGEPVQVIKPFAPMSLSRTDLSALPEPERGREALRLAREEAARPFDLERGPLVRASLVRLSEEEHLLLFNTHHIVADGWSMGVIVRELTALYGAFHEGRPAPFGELPVQYADYAAWQRGWLQGETLESQLTYWRRQLEGAPPALELVTDFPRAEAQAQAGVAQTFMLPAELVASLKALARREGATLFMVLLAAFQLLLARYTGQEDVLVLSPSAGRGEAKLEDLIGFFVNTLVLRTDLSGNPSFRELLSRVREVCLGAYAHEDVPFERVVEELKPERALNRMPLFQVMFVLQNAPQGELRAPGLTLEPAELEEEGLRLGAARYELEVHAWEDGGGRLGVRWVYDAGLFEAWRVEQMGEHYGALLREAVGRLDERVDELGVVGAVERERLLAAGAGERVEAGGGTLVGLFEAEAWRRGDEVAVECEGRRVTYAALDAASNRLARYLIGQGIGPGDVVALAVPRSTEMVVALWGGLKAGAAYLPIDTEYPSDRVAFMLADAGVSCVITVAEMAARLPGGHRLLVLDDPDTVRALAESAGESLVDAERVTALTPQHPAYVIYTSGSTGRPKGVRIPHEAFTNLLVSMGREVEFDADDVLLAVTSLSFDIAGLEMCLPLLTGMRMVIATREVAADGHRLAEELRRSRATVMQATPSTWRMLADAGWEGPQGFKVLCAGEPFPHELTQWMLGWQGAVYNLYGPSETTIYATAFRVTSAAERMSLGHPVPNTQCHVLDTKLNLLPFGVRGELYVAGAGLADGYVNCPALTAERFMPNPFSEQPGARMYRTGDLVERLRDGGLVFLGRADEQVKIRGHRVEPGEVETALREQPEVARAAVVARPGPSGELSLVGYVVAAPGHALDPQELRRRLARQLPSYLVPSAVVALDALPLLPNGKLNRAALPEPVRPLALWRAPRTPREEILCELFEEVLGVERVGLDDDFFELGGHSLLATRLTSRVRAALGVELPVRLLFESPNVGALAARLDEGERATRPTLEAGPRPPLPPASYAQRRLWFLDRLAAGRSTQYNMAAALRLRGPLDVYALADALSALVSRHESLRTRLVELDGEPVQVIDPPASVLLPVEDLSALGEDERERRLAAAVAEESARPFDLAAGPVLRARLLQLGPGEHVLLRATHHIASDGWSESLFARELAALYAACAAGLPSPLPPLAVQYADFALWQRTWVEGGGLAAGLDYWRRELEGAPAAIELPTDRPRSARRSFAAAAYEMRIEAELAAELKALSRREGATLFMTLLAAFAALLWRYTGQRDLVVGVPAANRREAGLESLIGFFVNTLCLRVSIAPGQTFRELLGEVRRTALAAYEHEEVPFERVVEELRPERSADAGPLFQVAFALQNAPRVTAPAAEVEVEEEGLRLGAARYELEVHAWEDGGGRLGVRWVYDAGLFEAWRVEQMGEHYGALLREAVGRLDERVDELGVVGAVERERLLAAGAGERVEADGGTLVGLFEAEAWRRGDEVAVECEERRVTYAALDAASNRLAAHLRRMGVGPEVLVGILLERSLEMVVGLLAVLKAGGAYVPLDPDYPQERLSFMLEDAGVAVLLTEQKLLHLVQGSSARVVCHDGGWLEPAPPSDPGVRSGVGPDNLAYVMYTSGSVGRPKGVLISHSAACNLIEHARELFEVGRGTRMLHLSSFSFDTSVLELFVALSSGAHLYLTSREQRLSPEQLADLVEREQLTVAALLPPWLAAMDEQRCASLRVVATGADRLTAAQARRWAGGRRLLNCYGPTEATVFATSHTCTPGVEGAGQWEEGEADAPIGRPIRGARAYVLDDDLRLVPAGVAGELYLAGAGLARGYLNRPALTAERFVPDPYGQPGARMYRTGDSARWRADGSLEFLGRVDQQVKVSGVRVEPGEVEAAIREHPAVGEAVVVARRSAAGGKRLVAYVTRKPGGGKASPRDTEQVAQVAQWQNLFDEIHGRAAPDHDPTFNINGWDSSYTGQPIPAAEMREWVDLTVERIASLRPSSVLEIGCGTGLMLFRVAPGCARYCGTDFSEATLRRLRRQIAEAGQGLPPVRLLHRAADDFSEIAAESFDTVIINSVVQYFPSADYLARVLEGAVKATKAGGAVFVGDVRSLPLLRAFHSSVLLGRAEPSTPKARLARRVQESVSGEEELVADPAFFDALKRRLPKVSRVRVLLKRGKHLNELTRFRYDVLLHIGREETSEPAFASMDWQGEGLTLERVRRLLEETAPLRLGVARVPNARVRAEVETLEWLTGDRGAETVGEFRDGLRETLLEEPGVDPEEIWALSRELPYDIDISWAASDGEGRYDIFFKRRGAGAGAARRTGVRAPMTGHNGLKPWDAYANNPLRGGFTRQLTKSLGSHLRGRLPDYMMPSAFVVLESLPLLPSGKVDMQALPGPEQDRSELERMYVAPRNPVEEVLAELWASVLGLERVGVEDGFFTLGGHSLLATQLISRARNVFQVELPLRWLFESATVADFAQKLIEHEPRPGQTIKVALAFQKVKAMRRDEREGVTRQARD